MEKIIDREVAWRIFAHEFNRSDLSFSEGDERSPNYIVTQTGVKCNRLFIVGVVTEVENIGQENNLWKARIADPTGVFTVYAGQYQPEAAIFLSEVSVPSFVALVGKARRFEPEDGSVYTSVRPEEIHVADEKQRDRWVLDAAERTLERIKIIEEALRSGLSGNDLKDFLQKKKANADGIIRAVEHYSNMERHIAELRTAVLHAVRTVAAGLVENKKAPEQQEEREETPIIHESANENEVQEPKEAIASILNTLDTGKGVPYAEVVETAHSSGIDPELVEAGIKELMSEGRCYEPKIGVLRKV